MAASERIEKFLADAEPIVKAGNAAKIGAEVARLRNWIQKHQHENVPESSKGQLLSCVELYFRSNWKQNDGLKESVGSLVGDCLRIPEGKLITSKSKKKLLKWLDAFSQESDGSQAQVRPTGRTLQGWILTDVSDEKLASIMSPDPGSSSILENIAFVDDDLAQKASNLLADAESDILVDLQQDIITRISLREA